MPVSFLFQNLLFDPSSSVGLTKIHHWRLFPGIELRELNSAIHALCRFRPLIPPVIFLGEGRLLLTVVIVDHGSSIGVFLVEQNEFCIRMYLIDW
ncbi:unnamed protein product [Rhodiola kirilowii]